MSVNLNEIEKDLVEFIANKRGRPYNDVEKTFLKIRQRFKFKGKKYEQLSSDIHSFFEIMYDTKDEYSANECNRFHALLHMLRYLSYTYPKTSTDYARDMAEFIKKRLFRSLWEFSKRKITSKFKKQAEKGLSGHALLAKSLIEKINAAPVVVDYGCGLAYVSFEIARLEKDAKIYLLDVDCLHLEFIEHRFRKYGFDIGVMRVTNNDLYPKLPKHNICIATEVMEHVFEPLTVYQNIHESMEDGGILYGNFEDHEKGLFHISPDLHGLRERISGDFEKVGVLCYRKVK